MHAMPIATFFVMSNCNTFCGTRHYTSIGRNGGLTRSMCMMYVSDVFGVAFTIYNMIFRQT